MHHAILFPRESVPSTTHPFAGKSSVAEELLEAQQADNVFRYPSRAPPPTHTHTLPCTPPLRYAWDDIHHVLFETFLGVHCRARLSPPLILTRLETATLASRGEEWFLATATYSDIVITCSGVPFKLHKMILCRESHYFAGGNMRKNRCISTWCPS